MNSQTTINLPDLIRNGLHPYKGEIGEWWSDREWFNLEQFFTEHGIEIDYDNAMSLDEALALIPQELELEAIRDIYDDPNATIIND